MKRLTRYPYLQSLLLVGTLIFSTSTTSPSFISTKVTTYTSYVKQRALFTKVFIRALWNFTLNSNPSSLIETKLAQLYEKTIQPTMLIESAVEQLQKAIKNNPHTFALNNFL